MAEIVFSPAASIDLANTYAHGVKSFGSEAALDYHRGLEAAIDRLAAYPQIGPIYPGLRPPVRFLAFRRHHIFYDYDGDRVRLIRILHHSQDAKGVL